MLATGEDFRVSGVQGGKPSAMNRFMHHYMDRVMELSTEGAAVRLALLEVFKLPKPPTAILRATVSSPNELERLGSFGGGAFPHKLIAYSYGSANGVSDNGSERAAPLTTRTYEKKGYTER